MSVAKFIPHCLGQRPAWWPWVFPKNGCVSGSGLRELQAAVLSWRRFQGPRSCRSGSRTLRAQQELTSSEDSGPGIQWSHWWREAHDRWTHMCLSRLRGQGQPTGHPPMEQTLLDWGKGQGREGSQEGNSLCKGMGVGRSAAHMGPLQELSERPLRMGRARVSAPRPSQGDCPRARWLQRPN